MLLSADFPACRHIFRLNNLVDGWKRDDGSVEYLSAADLKRVINGRDALAQRNIPGEDALVDPNGCEYDGDRPEGRNLEPVHGNCRAPGLRPT